MGFFPDPPREENSMFRRNIRLTAATTAAFALCLAVIALRHKHVLLDQRKLERGCWALGARTEAPPR